MNSSIFIEDLHRWRLNLSNCAFFFRTTTSQPRIQLCFSWLFRAALLAKFIVHQETWLHLLQSWVPTSSSTKFVKMFPLTRLLGSKDWTSLNPLGLPCVFIPVEHGYCSNHWVPYNGHCFYLNRTPQTWSNALKECRKEEGDLVSIRNVEDQSFVISQLGFGMFRQNDKHWAT